MTFLRGRFLFRISVPLQYRVVILQRLSVSSFDENTDKPDPENQSHQYHNCINYGYVHLFRHLLDFSEQVPHSYEEYNSSIVNSEQSVVNMGRFMIRLPYPNDYKVDYSKGHCKLKTIVKGRQKDLSGHGNCENEVVEHVDKNIERVIVGAVGIVLIMLELLYL